MVSHWSCISSSESVMKCFCWQNRPIQISHKITKRNHSYLCNGYFSFRYDIFAGNRWASLPITVIADRDCLTTAHGDEFLGHINVTASGEACMRWSDLGFDFKLFPNESSGDPANFCRNPDGLWFDTPSCYAEDPFEAEPCSVPFCRK